VPLTVAATVSALVAVVAWRARTLTGSGLVAAWSVGTSILYGAGWKGGAVLAAFFVSSNLVSRIVPQPAFAGVDPKSARRDLWQVYANGGAAAVGALVGLGDPRLGIWLITGALSAAAADTWATSIGSLSRLPPRLLWSGRSVAPGANGGMTLAGSAGAVAGALVVSGTAAVVAAMPILLPLGMLIGFLGMVADSTLGAVFQGRFHCPACDEASEWRLHRCGNSTRHTGGLGWLNNDGVNLLATILAACAALVAWWWID
jgi:uncharacterized protein (TIGR00297 family)